MCPLICGSGGVNVMKLLSVDYKITVIAGGERENGL